MAKITIAGAGHVGSQAALAAMHHALGDIVLLDLAGDAARAKAMDIQQAAALAGSPVRVEGTDSYAATANSDVVVITAGFARRPGMSRQDLFEKNAIVVRDVATRALDASPDAVVVVVTNPINLMAQVVYEALDLPRERVIGMAGVLDNARFATRVAELCGKPVTEVETLVAGDHGDLMVPLVSQSRVSGLPLEECLSAEDLQEAIVAARQGGTRIVNLLKTGSAYFAPGLSVNEILAALLGERPRLLSCSTCLQGEYGIDGVYLGVPVRVGRGGIQAVLELPVSGAERHAIQQAADYLKRLRGVQDFAGV